MLPFFSRESGNPSSTHAAGQRAKKATEKARGTIREAIGARRNPEIVFTSGGTESNFLAICGTAGSPTDGRDEIVTSSIEHKAVLAHCQALTKAGIRVIELPVDSSGTIDPTDVADAVSSRTILVSAMHANNEIGTIQPLREISAITHAAGALFHTDAVQSIAQIDFDVDQLGSIWPHFPRTNCTGPRASGRCTSATAPVDLAGSCFQYQR